jgi:hypothetical protein
MLRSTVSSFYIYSHKLAAKYLDIGYLAVSLCKIYQNNHSKSSEKERFMLKRTLVTVVGILALFGLAACGLSKEEISSLDNAAQQKLQKATHIFESDGLKAVSDYCEEKGIITTKNGSFRINCTVATLFYNPEDKPLVMDNKTILPVGIYSQAKNSMRLLDEGWEFCDMTISVFIWNEGSFGPIITKHKYFR